MDNNKPLNIALLNQSWFANELRALGHNVLTVGWVNESFDVVYPRLSSWEQVSGMFPENFTPSVVVYFDDSYPVNISGLEHLEYPSVFVSVDTHHHHSWHPGFSCIFDQTLVCQKNYIGKFLEFRKGDSELCVDWFPLWAPKDTIPNPVKDIDVCFRGNLDRSLHPERADFFSELSEYIVVDSKTGPYSEAYPRSKIVVNQTVKNDLNFRVFEAGMAGAMLVTPQTGNGLEELFIAGKEIVVYEPGNARHAADLIEHYLADDAERARIAHRFHQKVCSKHSASARARDFLDILLQIRHRSSSCHFLGAAASYLNSASILLKEEKFRKDDAYARVFNEFAARNLLASGRSEGIGESIRDSMLILCREFFEHCGDREGALEFARQYVEACPNNIISKVNLLDELNRQGKHEEALGVAAQVSDKPQELLSSVSSILDGVRQTLARISDN